MNDFQFNHVTGKQLTPTTCKVSCHGMKIYTVIWFSLSHVLGIHSLSGAKYQIFKGKYNAGSALGAFSLVREMETLKVTYIGICARMDFDKGVEEAQRSCLVQNVIPKMLVTQKENN